MRKRNNIIKVDLGEIGYKGEKGIHVAQNSDQWKILWTG
jgi:hypothetical protein